MENDKKSSSAQSVSWRTWLQDWMDEQRLERLKNCQVLDRLLKECQSSNKDDKTRTQLEDVHMGIRSVRYFQWRDFRPQQRNDDGDAPAGPSCAREEHAVWACRATGLKCGHELMLLRDCFRDYDNDQILQPRLTGYEHVRDSEIEVGSRPPCWHLQQRLGECVRVKAQELEGRRAEKRKRSSTSSS